MNVVEQSCQALGRVDEQSLMWTINALDMLRVDRRARVFCIGNGGGAAHATHFASDLRKIANLPALSFDNMAEMTARINDDGWQDAWKDWMVVHRFNHHDVLFVFSVGGGNDKTSANLSTALEYAAGTWTEALDRAPILGLVGAAGGDVARYGKPIIIPSFSTPVIEGCQSVLAHQIVESLCV